VTTKQMFDNRKKGGLASLRIVCRKAHKGVYLCNPRELKNSSHPNKSNRHPGNGGDIAPKAVIGSKVVKGKNRDLDASFAGNVSHGSLTGGAGLLLYQRPRKYR